MFDWLQPVFMQRALIALLCIAPACAAIGSHVISFRMSFYTNAISHSVFTGVALGLILGISTSLSTIIFGLVIAVLITFLSERNSQSRDTVIGVLFSGVVAFGIVVVSAKRTLTEGFTSSLYGDILSVSNFDLFLMTAVLLVTIIFEYFAYNPLVLIAVNETMARAHGIKTRFWQILLSIWVAVVVLVSLRVVGLLMATALCIVPAAAGYNFAKGGKSALFGAIIVSIVSALIGLAASYYLDSATGATVVLTSTIIYLITIPLNTGPVKKR